MSLVDEWIANLNKLGGVLDRRSAGASAPQQGLAAWERDAALQLKAGAR